MNAIKDLNKINDIIKNLNNQNFDNALKKLKNINIDFSNNNLVTKLFASIYFKKKIGKIQSNIMKKFYFLRMINLKYIIILVLHCLILEKLINQLFFIINQ